MQQISPCLWFDSQAQDAANFYVSIFPNSKITKISHYTDAGKEHHHKPAGSVMVAAFDLNGQPFTALNGGPIFKISEAVSFQINCDTQDELDHFWSKLSEGGDPKTQHCGWLKDKFGVSWQVVPSILPKLLSDPASTSRVMNALLQMKKIIIADLQKAAAEN